MFQGIESAVLSHGELRRITVLGLPSWWTRNGDLRATRLTAFEPKRILGSEIGERIVYFETGRKLGTSA